MTKKEGADGRARSTRNAAMLTAALMIVQQIGAKTVRDTFFLSNFPASELPKVMAGSAIMSLLGALSYSRILKRFGPARTLPAGYLIHGSAFLGEWWFATRSPELVSVILYLHMGALGGVVISAFWSLVNEQFDPHTAKKHVSRIAASAALGGVVGGLLAERVIANFGVLGVLPVLTGVTYMAAVVAGRVGGRAASKASEEPGDAAAVALGSTTYLRDLGAMVLITATTSGLVDYVFKAEASERFASAEALGSFFALFHAALSVLVFIVQSSLSSRSLTKLGIAGTVALLPGAVLLFGVLGAALTRMWSVALLSGFENLLRNSLFRAGYELLYTPVDKARKRAAKTIIDVGFDRLGDFAAAGLAAASLALLPIEASRLVVVLAAGLAVLGLVLALRLHRGYVEELAASLRKGTLRVADVKGLDAATRRTLTDATLAIDRQQLLDRIRKLQEAKSTGVEEVSRTSEPAHDLEPTPDADESDPSVVLEQARILLQGEDREILTLLEEALKAEHFDAYLIPLVVPLLARRRFASLAVSVLQKHAHGKEGTLMDQLLDTSKPHVVRRRIPRVLRELGTARARDGLLAGLDDDNFGVRYYCAQALFRTVVNHPGLAPQRERIFKLIDREAEASSEEWARPLHVHESDSISSIGPPQSRRPSARVEYAFLLLGTVLEREPLELCLKAVSSGDQALRGTALEYLENVLPARLHAALTRRLVPGTRKPREKRERQPKEIFEELNQSMSDLVLDLEGYQKARPDD